MQRPQQRLGIGAQRWLLAAFLIVAGGITYARLDPVTIHQDVSLHGVSGGLSPVVMAANFPVALIVGPLGFYFPNGIFLTDHPVAESGGKLWPAVHIGYHHGFGGTLFVLAALLLSRPPLRRGRRAIATRLYLSLMFAYGLVNLAQDFWDEQIVKRGWTEWQIPSAIQPRVRLIWLVILAVRRSGRLAPPSRTRTRRRFRPNRTSGLARVPPGKVAG